MFIFVPARIIFIIYMYIIETFYLTNFISTISLLLYNNNIIFFLIYRKYEYRAYSRLFRRFNDIFE